MSIYDDFKLSQKCANSTKAFVEASIANYENIGEDENDKKKTSFEDSDVVVEAITRRSAKLNRYQSFVETIKNVYLTEGLYHMYRRSVPEIAIQNPSDRSIMRSIVSQYVQENGYDNIMRNMKSASVTMCNMYNTINEAVSETLDKVDKDDPDTFAVTNDMKDSFFDSLNNDNIEDVSTAINNRVADAMNDFVTANAKDKDSINAALDKAKEKIDKSNEKDEELKESYNYQARREISEIRNSSKGIFHSMVSALAESVIKSDDPSFKNEFMVENHIDMDKTISRATLLYSFVEMLNTSRLEKINSTYLESMINNLKK